jgi:tetratricopeptide (TPR) repeat protein
LILLAGLISYWGTLKGPFVYDDLRAIVQNESIRLEHLGLSNLLKAAFSGASARRPVAGLSLALNYYAGGYSPWGFHAFNIAVHMLNGVLVYILALILLKGFNTPLDDPETGLLTPAKASALMAALLFTLHPIQTQAVSYVIQRMTSLATAFYLLAFILYLLGRERQGGSGRLFYAGAVVAWALALGSKEIAAMLPLSILAYEWCRRGSGVFSGRKAVIIVALVVLAAVACIPLFLGKDPLRAIQDTYRNYDFTMGERLLTQPRVVVFYLSLIILPLPSRLNLDHYFETSRSLLEPWTTAPSILFLALLLAFSLYVRRLRPVYAFAILWFFIHHVIESSFIGLDMVFEHRLYLPMFGICLALGSTVAGLISKRRLETGLVCGLIVLLLAWATIARNRVWQDEAALWEDAVSKNPRSHWARNSLGMTYLARGEIAKATEQLTSALRIRPGHSPTKINLAVALARQGRLKDASNLLEEVLSANPNDFEALYNMALVLAGEGRLDDAALRLKKALAIRPANDQANATMGRILMAKGNIQEAVPYIKKAIKSNPSNAEAHFLMAGVHGRGGDYNKALEAYDKALRLNPQDATIWAGAAETLLKVGRTSEAVKYYMEALRLEPGEALKKRILEILDSQKRR